MKCNAWCGITVWHGNRYLNAISGLDLKPQAICDILTRMMLSGTYDPATHQVEVAVPPTRSDVLHACDIAEDMAIAFGYNNLKKRPLTTITVGRQQPINQLTDLLRCVGVAVAWRGVRAWSFRRPARCAFVSSLLLLLLLLLFLQV